MHENWRSALDYLEEFQYQHLDLQIKIAEIPATYCAEKKRAEFMAQQLRDLNLHINIDHAGNVRALRAGRADKGNLIVIAAHLDAAFPATTDFKVVLKNGRLLGPSIVDNSLGLMAMVALVEAMNHADIETQDDLLFVATVGEEGLGDLRGVKSLLEDKDVLASTKAFIALDSQGHEHIVHRAMGSKRFRVDIKGCGGHSYLDFGTLNPLSAVAEIITRIDRIIVPEHPKTTFNVGVLSGGVSVNVIPETATFEMDLRSEDSVQLEALENEFLVAVAEGVASVNDRTSDEKHPLTYRTAVIGDRPCGQTETSDSLVTSAVRAADQLGLDTHYISGSSDANVPMNLGIPAIMLGAGGQGGGLHSDREWFDPCEAYLGRQRALLSLLLFDRA